MNDDLKTASPRAAAERQTFQTLCRMCDDHCALNVYLEQGRVVDIDGFTEHPWNRGRLCNKGRAAADLVYHPDRLWRPLKKTASGWQEIPLERALDEIASRVRDIQSKYGQRSVGVWKGEAVGFAQQEELARRFAHAIGSPNYFSNDSLCFNGRWIGYAVVHAAWSVPDYEQARCIVLWGANPPHAHPNMTQMIMRARRQGARLIVVDPRLSAIARQADVLAAPLPGTDGALVWGLIHLLVERGAYDRELVEHYSVGFPRLVEYARRFSPQSVEEQTGVPAATVDKIAGLMAQASPAVVNYVGNGLEHHENGINNIRAIAYLDTLLGALDRKGGNRLAEGLHTSRLTLYQERPLAELQPIGADRFPVLYGLRRECHTMTAMDAMLSGRPYPLKGLLLTAANPAMTNPNTDKVLRALGALELLVVRDLFLTETARLAHYVLPAATFLERSELHTHAMFQVVTLSRRLLSFPGVQDEYQFWHDLAHRLGAGAYFPWAEERELTRWLLEPSGITVEELERHPEGVPYRPIRYEKWREGPLSTPTGKVEFTSQYLKGLGYPELAEYQPPAYRRSPDPSHPFTLVTGARKLLFYHSRYQNIERFARTGRNPEMEIHPADAARLGLADGERARVSSRVGAIELPITVTAANEILPGIVQITHGYRQANVNLLTPDDVFDPISGFPLMKAIQVSIERVSSRATPPGRTGPRPAGTA
jgi:anaerobic selenocysteine-containing dehydrogenase